MKYSNNRSNFFTQNNDNSNKICFDVERSQNSLMRGRIGCGVIEMTKDIKRNDPASLQIAKKKAEALYRDRNRLPFNNKKCLAYHHCNYIASSPFS